MRYEVRIERSAKRDLGRLDRQVLRRVSFKIDGLADDPRPAGCLKLTGYDDVWRVRVGDYRILYEIADVVRIVSVQSVRHRRDAYE
ncbi:Plasmid stabilization system protein [Botrimarina colliarenosi]|uniref:Plasmid stabilization system protein n=1 Tax=Botrimarina colliarenosi TaxID=2528001 RepID=A0A5C6ANN2_9BACT|nr:type II toxin-antitoxin system RelE/ParE family toxin [Botrimarina colliarenosi]TWU00622.1 Plasmid stabilization system protein [Botrimarina colliarenosi]